MTLLEDGNHPGSRNTWLATGSLFRVWWKMQSLGLRLQHPLVFWLWLSHTCLFASGEGGPYMAAGLLSFGTHSVLCSVSMPGVMYIKSISWERLFFFLSLAIPSFGLLFHNSSLRLSSGHSGPVFTLRTDDADCASLPSPNSLVVEASFCATSPSPLVVAVRPMFCVCVCVCVFCFVFCFFFCLFVFT